ncbi:family type III secretion apparatus protein, putative [Babesia ovata]|uniref:Family type III secretion apparatus protein, putative n=1 Tax=Babesia ovata TaxID=189622 RepID=A0A2H6KA78_9APIC|nr:family type III secretion apparatus protein, putative [Babesia ovata]GBE59896.1 family type III secretion apparatus protein, putative [Babesia ovata]
MQQRVQLHPGVHLDTVHSRRIQVEKRQIIQQHLEHIFAGEVGKQRSEPRGVRWPPHKVTQRARVSFGCWFDNLPSVGSVGRIGNEGRNLARNDDVVQRHVGIEGSTTLEEHVEEQCDSAGHLQVEVAILITGYETVHAAIGDQLPQVPDSRRPRVHRHGWVGGEASKRHHAR